MIRDWGTLQWGHFLLHSLPTSEPSSLQFYIIVFSDSYFPIRSEALCEQRNSRPTCPSSWAILRFGQCLRMCLLIHKAEATSAEHQSPWKGARVLTILQYGCQDFCHLPRRAKFGFLWISTSNLPSFPLRPTKPTFLEVGPESMYICQASGDLNVTKLENLWAESFMILWVNSLTSSDPWVEQFGESYDQNKPVSLVSYANGHRGLIITWQHKCPIISVCRSVPGDQLFCNNGHAQHWTACIPLSCSPPHSFLMREEPLSSQGFNPLLPGPKDQNRGWGGSWHEAGHQKEVEERFSGMTEYLGQLALCI